MGRRFIQDRDFLPSIPSGAGSIVSGIPSAVSAAATAVPSAIASAIPNAVEAILPRNGSVGIRQVCVDHADHVSCASLPLGIASLLVGLLLIFVFTCLSIAFVWGRLSFLADNIVLRTCIHLISGLLCWMPFLVPVVTARALASAAEKFPWIRWQLGEAYGPCVGALCCAGCVVILGSIVRTIL